MSRSSSVWFGGVVSVFAPLAGFLARREEGVGWGPATDEQRRAARSAASRERENKRGRINFPEPHTSGQGCESFNLAAGVALPRSFAHGVRFGLARRERLAITLRVTTESRRVPVLPALRPTRRAVRVAMLAHCGPGSDSRYVPFF